MTGREYLGFGNPGEKRMFYNPDELRAFLISRNDSYIEKKNIHSIMKFQTKTEEANAEFLFLRSLSLKSFKKL